MLPVRHTQLNASPNFCRCAGRSCRPIPTAAPRALPSQAESFPPTKNALPNEYVIVFSNAGGRVRGKSTVNAFASNGTATIVSEYKNALHGVMVRGKPAVVAALIDNHPDEVLSIELNMVVRKLGSSTLPTGKLPGLWGLDRIDQARDWVQVSELASKKAAVCQCTGSATRYLAAASEWLKFPH